MKKSFSSAFLRYLMLMGGVFVCIVFTACENFLDGAVLKKSVEKEIEWEKAESLSVLVTPEEGTGSTVPFGNYDCKLGYFFEVSFTENYSYSFIKWAAVSADNLSEEIEGVLFEDASSPKTTVKFARPIENVRILPVCTQRIAVSGEPSPRYEPNGVARDRSISVTFTKELSEENFIFQSEELPQGAVAQTDDDGKIWAYVSGNQTFLKNISITNADDFSIAEHFSRPQVNGRLLTIPVDKTKPIQFNSGEVFKTIKVTLSKEISDSDNIKMNYSKSWNYLITEATDEKATVNLSGNSSEGSVYLAGTKDYSLGQKITLAFTENTDWQFIKWDYDSSVIYIDNPESINTTAVVLEKTTEDNPTQIRAVCARRLRLAENGYEPKTAGNETVSKNSSIQLTFDQNLPADAEDLAQLANLSITVGGTPVRTCFNAPVISGNTVSFTANKSNMLDVTEGQTKTVTVTIPADFYYKLDDGTKVTWGGNGFAFDYRIDSTTTQKASVVFEMETDSGTITPAAGLHEYSEGQEVAVSFVSADGWEFRGWTVKTGAGDDVPASKIKILDPDALSTKLIVYEALSDVKVRADAVLLPAVSSFTPAYESGGKDCDTPVVIIFNKAMKTDTFNLYSEADAQGMKGTIKIVNPSNEYEHYEEYFNEPAWSADGKTLTLKPKNTIRDALVKNDSDLRNIRIVFDISKVSDTDGNKLKEADASWVYRINHSMETIAPTVTMKMYKRGFELSQNENGKYFAKETGEYTELSDLAFSQFVTDTYPLNHVGKNIYFDAYVIDEGSGYNNLTIKETLIKTTADNDVNAQTYYYETSFSKETDSFNDSINTDSVILYSLQSTIDGLVRLDFVFEDFAHSSTVVTYYVIKDTQLNENVYQKDSASQEYTSVFRIPDMIEGETRSCLMYYEYTDTETAAIRRFCNEDNNFNEVIKFSNKDEYYKISINNKYASYAHYNVFWGYDENDNCNEVEESSERTFSFTRDVTKDCFIRITVFDDAGNFFTDTAKIPKQHSVAGLKENSWGIVNNNPVNYYTLKTTFSSYSDYYIFYRYKANEASEFSEFRRHRLRSSADTQSSNNKMGFQYENPLFKDETLTPDGIYYIYDLPYNNSSFGDIEGTMSEPFVVYHNCEGSTSTDAPDFPDDFTCEINPAVPDSTGKRQVSVSLPETFVKTQGCYYGVTYGSGENFYDFNFTVNSGSYHDIYLCAMDSEGTFYKSKKCKTVNASYDNTPPKMQEISEDFCYKDLSAPNEILLTQKKDGYNNQPWHKIYLPIDIGGSGLYEKDEDTYEFDYYLKKRNDTEITKLNLSREDLEGLEKHTVSYPKTAKQIKLNFNEPVESYYVLILDLKDKNTNYALVNCTVSNIIVPFYPDFYLEGNSTSDYSIKIDNLKINKISYYFDCCTLSDTEWTFKKRYIQGSDDAMKTCSFSNETVPFVRCGLNGPSNSFYKFICPEYWIKKNAGNSTECKSKSVIPGLGGAYQVYYDAPCFAHTMAFPTGMLGDLDAKLAEAKAIDSSVDDETYIKAIWETKGREYGLKLINSAWLDSASTATYTAPVSEIPAGYSYVTIFHFADGTSVMSEVKQK